MDALALLDRLEALVSGSARVPLTSRVIVDEDSVYALIDDLRELMPEEVKEAKWVMRERDRLLEEAKKEAQGILDAAGAEAAKRIEESEIVAEARRQADRIVEEARGRAEEIVAQARRLAQEIKRGANEYALALLEKLETHLLKSVESVRNGRSELKDSMQDDVTADRGESETSG
ncbi:MAG: ATPase [Firmicutes bacterium]|nr:ATPase [Bacillota bacterium]